jgi:hypothetical protein
MPFRSHPTGQRICEQTFAFAALSRRARFAIERDGSKNVKQLAVAVEGEACAMRPSKIDTQHDVAGPLEPYDLLASVDRGFGAEFCPSMNIRSPQRICTQGPLPRRRFWSFSVEIV